MSHKGGREEEAGKEEGQDSRRIGFLAAGVLFSRMESRQSATFSLVTVLLFSNMFSRISVTPNLIDREGCFVRLSVSHLTEVNFRCSTK